MYMFWNLREMLKLAWKPQPSTEICNTKA